MLLAFDIGNSTVSVAVMAGNKFKLKRFLEFRVSSKPKPGVSKKQVASKLKTFIKAIYKEGHPIDQILICSVVPEGTSLIEKSCRKLWKAKILVVGRDIRVPIKNNYSNPKQVGQDRLVGAFAAKRLYGAPLIIIDLGTAITFDVVSKSGTYEGGIIVPGIRLSLESLFKKTALLPRIEKIDTPKNLIGRDTKTSMLSGIFNGYGALCTGLIQTISHSLKARPKVIMTGGHTQLIKKYIRVKIDAIDADLVFKGLNLLARHHPRKYS